MSRTDHHPHRGGDRASDALHLERVHRDVSKQVRLGWVAKLLVFALAAPFVPGIDNRWSIVALLIALIPVQLVWHRVLPNTRLASTRPVHDAVFCTAVAALSPALWPAALLIFTLAVTDPAHRRRSRRADVLLAFTGVLLILIGAGADPAWLANSIVATTIILLRGRTGDEIWAQLESVERQRSELLEAVSAVVWAADPRSKSASFVSSNVERVTGWTPEEWTTIDHCELIHPDDLDAFWLEESELVEGDDFERSARFRHKDGRWIWLNVVNRAITDRNGDLRLFGYFTDATDLIERHARMHRRASSDELTGLANRHVLLEELNARFDTTSPDLALLMIDLDRFKEINDTLGHATGDAVLCSVAERLRLAAPDGLVCRLGGDEFALLLDDATTVPRVVRAITHHVSTPIAVDDLTVTVEASIGSVLIPTDATTTSEALRRGDAAMYQAKRRGQPHMSFTPEMERHSALELELSATLSSAVDSGQFELHFQPQIELATGRLVGAEGLVRWNHPTHGVIRPNSFIHLVGLSNVHGRFADLVVEQACAFAASAPDPAFSVAVNISAMSLFDPDFAARIADAVIRHRLEPSQLIIEITESEIMEDHSTSRDVIMQLSELGVHLSIDDFGTGYSSLTRLIELPVSELKIDQSFVAAIMNGGPARAVVDATIDMGHRLGLQMVAEGIESHGQAEYLAEQGCQVGQGYLYGQAVSADEFRQRFMGERAGDSEPAVLGAAPSSEADGNPSR